MALQQQREISVDRDVSLINESVRKGFGLDVHLERENSLPRLPNEKRASKQGRSDCPVGDSASKKHKCEESAEARRVVTCNTADKRNSSPEKVYQQDINACIHRITTKM